MGHLGQAVGVIGPLASQVLKPARNVVEPLGEHPLPLVGQAQLDLQPADGQGEFLVQVGGDVGLRFFGGSGQGMFVV